MSLALVWPATLMRSRQLALSLALSSGRIWTCCKSESMRDSSGLVHALQLRQVQLPQQIRVKQGNCASTLADYCELPHSFGPIFWELSCNCHACLTWTKVMRQRSTYLIAKIWTRWISCDCFVSEWCAKEKNRFEVFMSQHVCRLL